MKASKFKEANICLGKPESMTDEQCSSLWVYSDGEECLSLWKLSFIERIKALLFGKIWLCVLSGKTQPPVWVSVENSAFKS